MRDPINPEDGECDVCDGRVGNQHLACLDVCDHCVEARSRLAAAEEREAALRVDRERLIALLEHHEPSGDCGNAGCGTCLLGYVLRHLKEDEPFPELNTRRIRAALDKETTCDS